MKDVTVGEAKIDLRVLEHEILSLIRAFEETTGLWVARINLLDNQPMGNATPHTIVVEAEARLSRR